jgi:hypothetical protein
MQYCMCPYTYKSKDKITSMVNHLRGHDIVNTEGKYDLASLEVEETKSTGMVVFFIYFTSLKDT